MLAKTISLTKKNKLFVITYLMLLLYKDMVTPSICKLCNEIPLTHKNIEKDLRNILLSVFLHLEECVFCMKTMFKQ